MSFTEYKQTEIGMFPEDWKIKKLKEVASYNTEKISIDEVDLNEFVSTENMVQDKEGVTLSSGKPKTGKATVFEEKDILFSNIRTYFRKIYFAKFSGGCSNDVLVIRPNQQVHHKYLYYFLSQNDFFDYTVLTSKGTKMPRGDKDAIMNYLINVPLISEQKTIAKILSDLDEKIEVNRQMNEILEELGQTVFKRWFVDFEFPNEKGKPYKSSSGRMVESELGEIPKGWEIKELGDFIDVQKGLSYKGKFLVDNGGIPMANLGTFKPPGGFKPEGLKCYVGEYKDRNLVKPGDIIVANTDITQNADVLGSPSIIPRNIGSDKVLFTHHIFAIRHKEGSLTNYFLYFLLQSPDYRARSKGFATGTTVLAIPKEAILELQFVCSPDEIRKRFDSVVKPVFDRITLNSEQIESLSKTRDLILPKLMTGKIRVKL